MGNRREETDSIGDAEDLAEFDSTLPIVNQLELAALGCGRGVDRRESVVGERLTAPEVSVGVSLRDERQQRGERFVGAGSERDLGGDVAARKRADEGGQTLGGSGDGDVLSRRTERQQRRMMPAIEAVL